MLRRIVLDRRCVHMRDNRERGYCERKSLLLLKWHGCCPKLRVMTYTWRWTLVFAGLLTLLHSNVVSAQEQDSTKIRKWVTLSFMGDGYSFTGSSGSYAGGLIGYNFGRRLLHQVQAIGLINRDPLRTSSAGYDVVASLSYALGRGNLGKHSLTAVFAGPGVVRLGTGLNLGGEPLSYRTTFGLALNAQAIAYLTRGLGLGIHVYLNANPRASLGAVHLMLVIGGNRR